MTSSPIYLAFAQMLTDAFVITGNPYTIIQIESKVMPGFPFITIGRAERIYGLNTETGHFQVEIWELFQTDLADDFWGNEAANRDAIENNYHGLIQALQSVYGSPGYLITPTYSINGTGNSDVGTDGVTSQGAEVRVRCATFTVNYGLKDG